MNIINYIKRLFSKKDKAEKMYQCAVCKKHLKSNEVYGVPFVFQEFCLEHASEILRRARCH